MNLFAFDGKKPAAPKPTGCDRCFACECGVKPLERQGSYRPCLTCGHYNCPDAPGLYEESP